MYIWISSTVVTEEYEDTKGVINQIPYIVEEHTTQWPNDTKGVINQIPYIVEEQTIQWPNKKVQKDKKRSTKHTYKTKTFEF